MINYNKHFTKTHICLEGRLHSVTMYSFSYINGLQVTAEYGDCRILKSSLIISDLGHINNVLAHVLHDNYIKCDFQDETN